MTLPSLDGSFKSLLFNHKKLLDFMKIFSFISKIFLYFKYKKKFFHLVSIDWGTLDVDSPTLFTFSGEVSISGNMELTQFGRELFWALSSPNSDQENTPHQHTIEPLSEDEIPTIVIRDNIEDE